MACRGGVVAAGNTLSVLSVASLIRDVEHELQDVLKFSQEVVKTLDQDNSGDISADEFLRCLAKEPMLLQTFQSCVQVTVRSASTVVEDGGLI